jgi:heme-binding NEAT domain protein
MAKTFYTEQDIEDLARRGILSLVVNDNVVMTELAVEKAQRLGVNLVRPHDTPPSAPIRPYIASGTNQASARASSSPSPVEQPKEELRQKVYIAAIARLGNAVDPALLDTIIRRVLDDIGVK